MFLLFLSKHYRGTPDNRMSDGYFGRFSTMFAF